MGNQLEKPVALDRETQQKIITFLARGNYLKVACKAAGTSYDTFYHWKLRWEQGDPVAQKFDDFFKAIDKAVSAGETAALDRLLDGPPNWQAQAWFLERRFSARWGKKDRMPDPPKPPKPPKDLKDMNKEEMAAYENAVAEYERRFAKN